MTDEAFIRAVLAAPGQDTPRLVYADWLDDRGEPARAAYLRAEAAAPGGVEAAGLDPVWVARVSRPPRGVCCDRVRFDCNGIDPGPGLAAADLDAYERRHRLALPAAYRAFLLNRNGGSPYPGQLVEPEYDDLVTIDHFVELPPAAGQTDFSEPEVTTERCPSAPRMIWVAADGNCGGLFLGLDGEFAGRVYWNTDVVHIDDATIDDFHELAPDLAALFPLLTTDDPDGMQLLVRGDEAGFEAWLAAGGDVNQAHPESGWALLETAVQCGRTAFVRRLLGRGAVVNRTAWEVAKTGNNVPAEARALVLAACPAKPDKPGKKRKKT